MDGYWQGVTLMRVDEDGLDPEPPDGDDLVALDELALDELAPEELSREGVAAQQVRGDLELMDDAGVIGVAVQCRQAAARAQGRMYRALQELERRRPPRKRFRRGEDERERRDAAEGTTGDVPFVRVPVLASVEVASEIALAFTATEYAAEKLAGLSADLWGRLPKLHLELEAGRTDADRVKIMWEGTRDLSDEDAGKVDALLAARSGAMTTGELRDAVRRAVIRIDPAAAEKRRKRAEKNARMSLYANENHTATLALEDIPAAQGAAAKARVNAIARAAKSAGAAEELALLEAMTAVGLLLGTLPLIRPAGPPDDGPGDPGDGHPGDVGPDGADPAGGDLGECHPGDGGPGDADPGEQGSGGSGPGGSGPEAGPVDDNPGDAWPSIPDTSAAAAPGCAPVPDGLRPRQGRIRLLTPWRTLAGLAGEPGDLSWFGPVTPTQARELASAAAADTGARWSLIVTDDDGRAIAFAVLRHPRETAVPGLVGEVTLTIAASLAAGLNCGEEMRDRARQLLAGLDPAVATLLEEAIAVADKAALEAELGAILDAAAGGCAHATEVGGYKVPETMRRWLIARDRTCRNPVCRHRATQCDMDHTLAFGKGGRTCPCDLGALCRRHHQLKQADGWHLRQDGKGAFTWTTPAGLAYRQEPHQYAI